MGKEKTGDLFTPKDIEENMIPAQREDLDILGLAESDMDLDRRIEAVEKRVELFKKIKLISLKLTKPTDWLIRKSGSMTTVYLQEKGSENIALAWGIDITNLIMSQEWHKDDSGQYYIFQVAGRGYSRRLQRSIEDIGVCSQRDTFLGKVGGEYKALEDVDITNIKRKAVTNLYNRIIKRMVGLMSTTIEDLQEIGFDVSKIPVVDYAGTGGDRARAAATLPPDVLERREMIWKICLALGEGETSQAKLVLKNATTFQIPDPKDATKKVDKYVDNILDLKTEKWINGTYGKLKDQLYKSSASEFVRLFPDEDPTKPAKNGGR